MTPWDPPHVNSSLPCSRWHRGSSSRKFIRGLQIWVWQHWPGALQWSVRLRRLVSWHYVFSQATVVARSMRLAPLSQYAGRLIACWATWHKLHLLSGPKRHEASMPVWVQLTGYTCGDNSTWKTPFSGTLFRAQEVRFLVQFGVGRTCLHVS